MKTRMLEDQELRIMLGACAHAQPVRDDLRAEDRLEDYTWRGESRGGWAQVAMGVGIGLLITGMMVIWGILWL